VYLSLYNLYTTSRGRKGYFRWREDICHFIDRNWLVLFPKRRKTATWCSTVAGILSSGCPQFFKSGTKEFSKEPGWWGLQQTVAPAIKFSEAGSGSTRKRKGGLVVMGSNTKTNSNNFTDDKPTNVTVHSSCKDENAGKSSSPEDKSQSEDLISQLLSEEDIRELAESRSGLCRQLNLMFI